MQIRLAILLARICLPVTVLAVGCQKEPAAAPTAKDDSSAATAQPAQSTDPDPAPAEPREPKRPEPSWIIFREAYNEEADAVLVAEWSGGNRLEVTSENVSRVTLDLTKLPPDAPQTGPWILHIDRQGIQITGARGKVLDLVRSINGDWSVDKDKYPPRETTP